MRRLDAGEWSETYVATDNSNKETVRVTLLWPKFALQPQVIDQFVSVPKSLVGLEHSSLPQVLSIQSDETGIPFIVEEYFDGQTLSKVTENFPGSIPVGMAFNLLLPIVAAVAKVHEQGIVHGRINADNILIADVGKAQLSKLLHLCTPSMSDEHKKDAGYDVWSIGVVYYEVFTGERLFRDKGQDTSDQSSKVHLSLRKKAPHLPSEVYDTIDKCLDPDPKKRPATAGELLQMLLEVQERQSGISAPKPIQKAKSTKAPPEPAVIRPPSPPTSDKKVAPQRKPDPVKTKKSAPKPKAGSAQKPKASAAPKPKASAAQKTKRDSAPEPIIDSAPAPLKRRPEPEKEVEAKNLDPLTDFGHVPIWPIFGMPYAIRVFFKLRKIRTKLEEMRTRSELVIAGAERELHKLGESLYERRSSDPKLKVLERNIEEVARLEESYKNRKQAYENRSDASDGEMGDFQSQLDAANEEAQPLRRQEIDIKDRLAKLHEDTEKAEKHKRMAEGELRAIENSPGGQDALSKVSELENQYRAKKNEFEEITMEISNVNQELAQVRRQLAIHQTSIRMLNEQIRTVTTTKDYGMKVHESALEAVDDNIKRELSELAREALLPENANLVAGNNQALIANDAVRALEIDTKKREVYESALTGYHKATYKTGLGILFGFIALVISGVAVLILLLRS